MPPLPSAAPQSDDPQDWVAYGLTLMCDVPPGIEGAVRQQQAALALIQAQRCGWSTEEIERSLAGQLAAQLAEAAAMLGLGLPAS
ncbi:hypothetical protein [Vulcanococcus limneticus]|uniref:hypothetical protein n=1 Tax=Vulcanococcus limneticus TaxID=2170428 RepID=UPI00398BDDB8